MYLTGRAPFLVALGVVPLVLSDALGWNAWLVGAVWVAIVLVVIGADILVAPDPSVLGVARSIPARTRLGEPVQTELWVTNPGTRTVRGRVRDGWQPTAGAPEARLRVSIPGGERRRLVVPLRPRRRGELRTAFIAVRSAGPLGFAGRQSVIAAPGRIRVLPPFTARKHLASRVARLRELDGNTSVQVRGQGTEFDSLREYVRGDDVRSIDWRATARAGQTMLRTWRPERDRHVVIVIDTGRTAAARVGDGTRLDAAMEAALLLAALAQRAGDHVHLLMFDRLVRAQVTGVDGPGLLPALTDAMAPVDPQLIDTDWDAAFAQVRTFGVRPSLVVLLTAQDEPQSSRAFLGALGLVSKGARLVVGSATDTLLGEIAADGADADAVYRAAAAEQTAHEASLVAAAVQRAGGDAIADTPELLPPRIADRYLELKAAGRL
ncbi:DUF58 domain-containing protein [Microbacterium gorillae]|uniref:DUF58 domain-containing protein n=1 Tax=Microbacterium gorillae TaxID=1231063 RepID=UPI00058ACB9D|nr:DUF58 domain-containing protein [Microbacterium gorillae]